MKQFENYAIGKGISFNYDFIDFNELKTRLIHAREIDLERSFKIVIDNAIIACYNKDYSKDSPKINVNFKEQRNNEGLWLFITASDNGIGIKKENVEEIFEPFVSLWPKKDFNPEEPNIGLGLFKLRTILKNYDAKIQIRTKLNEGTSFIFQIPI